MIYHINFEVSLHFWEIRPTVCRRRRCRRRHDTTNFLEVGAQSRNQLFLPTRGTNFFMVNACLNNSRNFCVMFIVYYGRQREQLSLLYTFCLGLATTATVVAPCKAKLTRSRQCVPNVYTIHTNLTIRKYHKQALIKE